MKKTLEIIFNVGYWLMYFLMVSVIGGFIIAASGKDTFLTFTNDWLPLMIGLAFVPGIIGFYGTYTLLYPKYFTTKRFTRLFSSSIGLSVIAGLLGVICVGIDLGWDRAFSGSPHHSGLSVFIQVLIFTSFMAFVNAILGLVIKGFLTSYNDIKLKEDLNKKNYETELALIKSQLNPHFLFNTINNIDIMIGMDPEKASIYLNKLSEIMRFMLYENKSEKIDLKLEVNYIEKYIELQKIRSSHPDYVKFELTGEMKNKTIAPMLFIPFIENAFKHSETKKGEATIDIKIDVQSNSINFECRNLYSSKAKSNDMDNGLGNDLIQKRLNLLYPNHHSIQTIKKENQYITKLSLY